MENFGQILDEKRKEILKKVLFNYRLYVILISSLIIYIMCLFKKMNFKFFGKIPIVFLLIIIFICIAFLFYFTQFYYLFYKDEKKKFEYLIKKNIVSNFLKEYKYDPKNGLLSDFINDTDIYVCNDFITHDLVTGFYKRTEFEFCLAKTYYENNRYSNDTHGKKEILDNTEFNHEFRVFGDDEIEARYLLDFLSMEKIVKFQQIFGNCAASFAFINNKFYIFLHNQYFNYTPSLFFEIDKREIETFVDKIKHFISFIDFLWIKRRMFEKNYA